MPVRQQANPKNVEEHFAKQLDNPQTQQKILQVGGAGIAERALARIAKLKERTIALTGAIRAPSKKHTVTSVEGASISISPPEKE